MLIHSPVFTCLFDYPAVKHKSSRVHLTFALYSLAALLFTTAPQVNAADPHVVVPGYDRFRADDLGSVAAGRLLISELNCQSCHGEFSGMAVEKRQAPVLTHIANRVTPEFLQAYLADPQSVKPGTAMPQVLSGANLQEEAKAIAHFLASGGANVQTPVSDSAVKRGEQKFHSLGCAACHGDQRKAVGDRPDWVMPLGKLDLKYSVGSLVQFLKDPHTVRPSGRMPSLNLAEDEARDLANYLLRNINVEPNLTVEIYSGNWDKLPDFEKLKPESTEAASDFAVSATTKRDRFALRFTAWLHIPEDGEYRFWIGSDDGSRLLVDGEPLITVDGIHPHQTKEARKRLTTGPHPVVVEYFEQGGEESLKVEVAGPSVARQPLAGLVTNSSEPPEKTNAFRADPELVSLGAKLFVSRGCSTCHRHDAIKAESSTKGFPNFAELDSGKGCLAAAAEAGVPRFYLSEQQRMDIAAAIDANGSGVDSSKSVDSVISQIMLTFNCYACHQRSELGGVPRIHDHLFAGSIPEMGDEGRIPPHLNGIGDKLQVNWLREVLNKGAKDRPYMATRMPKFGEQNVGKLIELFAETDAKTEVPEVVFDDPPHRVKSAARSLVGDQALSCIKCHYFDKYKATGIQSLDMTTMTKRLRRDWFHRYLINPQQFRPGTRMPGSWPNGKSVMRNVLHGDTGQQIEAIWQYLAEGKNARLPSGLVAKAIELKPLDRPIIYRNFIQGLSARGIAVGSPRGAHYAWDAEQMNLRLIWHHEFIDAAKHWVGRGPGYQTPLGDHVMELVSGQPFAVLNDLLEKWPAESSRDAGFHFRGYKLNPAGQPTFRYDWKGNSVEDFIEPVEHNPDAALRRTLSIHAEMPEGLTYFRMARAPIIDKVAEGWLVSGSVLITVSGAEPVLRESDGHKELIVPVTFSSDGNAQIGYQMTW